MRRLFVAFLCTFVALPLVADAGAERLSGDFRAALEVSYPETPELRLHDALGRLREYPDTVADLEAVRAAAETQKDASLAPILDTLLLLTRATGSDPEPYRAGLADLRKATTNAQLLALADLTDALGPCPACAREEACRICAGSLKCPACKGRGFTAPRAASSGGLSASKSLGGTSLASSNTRRLRCATCKGSGKCPTCGGTRKVCTRCRNSRKVPVPEKVNARIAQVAGLAQERTATAFKEALTAREQTARLAEDLRKAQALSDPAAALGQLTALPAERATAAQWSHVATLRADLEAIVRERDAHSAEKEAARAAVRAAVAQAQRAQDPLQGMALLVPFFSSHADCDALPEAKTAFDGLLAAARTRQEAQVEALGDRISAIAALSLPADRVAQAEACLSDWPGVALPKALRDYAKAEGLEALTRLEKASALEDLRARLETLRAAAAKAQAEAEAKPAWWVWAGGGAAALVALYALWAIVQGALERRAEAARKARQRAAIESIRNTFSHRRGH